MGLIRGALATFVTVLLLLSLLAGNFFMTLNLSLDYEIIQEELGGVITELAIEEGLLTTFEDNFEIMTLYCMNNTEFVFSPEEGIDHVFVVPCSVISEGQEAVISHSVNNLVETAYYAEYDCEGFFNCVGDMEDGPFYLVSKQAKDRWRFMFYMSLLISLILAALLFVLVETRSNALIVIGAMLIVSSLPFVKFGWFLSLLNLIFFFADEMVLDMFSSFFTKSRAVFIIGFFIGIILLIAGIVWKLFAVGFQISGLFDRFKKSESVSKQEVKSIVKKEMVKPGKK